MSNANAAVAVFDTTLELSSAIHQIQFSGFDAGRLSVAAKDRRPASQVVGYYRDGAQMRYWGELGALWNEVFGLLSGWGFFVLPNIGPLLVAGPLATWIATALNNAPIFGEMTAVGVGLYSVGISRDSIRIYERALRDGKFILLVHGPASEVQEARDAVKGL